MRLGTIAALLILWTSPLWAAETGRIVGQVTDAATGEGLAGAAVLVAGLGLGATADTSGRFEIEDVPAGVVRIEARMVGYASAVEEDVRVEPGKAVARSFELRPIRYPLKEILVTATRRASDPSEVAAFASVTRREEIVSRPTGSLRAILKTKPSLQVREYGGAGSPASTSLRGSSSAQVLVLVDGERVNDARSGGADFNLLSMEAVERVEVVRGGYSALYGADAVGGVIHIITQAPDGNAVKVWSQIGSFGEARWGGQMTGVAAPLSGLLCFSSAQGDQDYKFRDKGVWRVRENADFRSTNLFGKSVWRGDKGSMLIFSGERIRTRKADPGPIGLDSPRAFRSEQVEGLKARFVAPLSKSLLLKGSAHGRWFREHYFNPDGVVVVDDVHRIQSWGSEARMEAQFGDVWVISGGNYRADRLRSTGVGDHVRAASGGYAQSDLVWKGGAHDGVKEVRLFPAFRVDAFSDFGAQVSPKLGVAVRFNRLSFLRFKGNIGRSYRAPTLNDLYWPEDNFSVGNPDLKAERSFDMDAGCAFSSKGPGAEARGSLAYFRNQFRDEIVWQPGQNGKWTPLNMSRSIAQGLECEAEAAWKAFRSGGTYTLLRARDALGRVLLYRPKHAATTFVQFGRRGITTTVEGRYESRRYTKVQNTKWLDPYWMVDARLSLERKLWGVTGRMIFEVENVFDRPVRLQEDYPLPGRSWHLKLESRLGQTNRNRD
ncbi:MAG: TonB-dependent receptor [Candidatus Latescibacteria bacterium]|nr:TonB-dependent receptor [Candidatus Latescibacterota bacterium]